MNAIRIMRDGRPATDEELQAAVESRPLPPSTCSALGEQVAGQHYKGLAIQPAEYCQRNRLPYCESSVIRYVTRHRDKNGREDIEKAIHCLRLLLEIEYSEPNSRVSVRP